MKTKNKSPKTPAKVHTDPWKKYAALKRAAPKPPTGEAGPLSTGARTPPSPAPAPSLESDAQAAIGEATRANPPRQWDQPGGPAAPLGEATDNPPSRVDRADRKFSSAELAQIAKDARDAIAKGAPRAKVEQRLKENGIDPAGVLHG
jgi:hypothetical protein